MRVRWATAIQVLGIACIFVAIVTTIVVWPYGGPMETNNRVARTTGGSARVARTGMTGEPVPPFYGPPSPEPPIYGPPSPPSRVPLLDHSRRFNAPILNVTGEDLRPAHGTTEPQAPVPWGWASLDLDRGIPFVQGRARRDHAQSSQTDARRAMFERAAPDPAPVSVAYCLDPAIGAGDVRKLEAARSRIKAAVAELRPRDRFTVVLLDAQGTELFGGWQTIEERPEPVRWSSLDAVAPAASARPGAGLSRAMGMEGATHVVAIAMGEGECPADETARLRQLAKAASPRVIALAVGGGAASSVSDALRDLAMATNGAFAWLRPSGSAGASPSRERDDGP